MKFNIWSQYTLQRGVPGLSLGLGVFAQNDMFGDRLNTAENVIPGFTRVDAMLGYQYKHIRLQLNIQNLGNVKTFQRSIFGSFVSQSPSRVLASLAFEL